MENTKLEICKKCWGTGRLNGGDENSTWSKTCEECHGIGFVRVTKTNADRIRAMSDEELAQFIRDVSYECQDAYCRDHCQICAYPWCSSERTMEWLKQTAE